jgi:hypothetical protein
MLDTSPEETRRLDLVCALCGYGIVSSRPPAHCPMCHDLARWIEPRYAGHAAPGYAAHRPRRAGSLGRR